MIDRIPNPWEELPLSPPIVAPVDAPVFARHPDWVEATTLLLDRLPSPFLGPLDAPVLMVGLNPSGKDNDRDYGPGYAAQRRLELGFAADRPYISLNPRYAYTPGYAWHHLLLRTLIAAVGDNDVKDGTERVAHGLLWLQLFGYQSAAWRSVPRTLRRAAERGELPSQAFAFQVLCDAIGSGKTIIVARSFKEWTQSVPELTSYDYIVARNKRRPFVTPNNLVAPNSAKPEAAFDRVVATIRNHPAREEPRAC